MIIRKYGIVLKRLKEEDIELVRQMRNSEAIRRTMVYREEITPEMQKRWFDSINNKYNAYCLIISDGLKIGMIHGNNVNFEKRTCEGGIFIWDKRYLTTPIPSLASIIMNDWTFLLANFKTVYAKVLVDNKVAISYNKMQGYEPCEPLNNEKGVVWMKLTRENYLAKIDAIRKNMAQYTHDEKPLGLDDLDASDDLGKEVELFYTNLPPDIQAIADKLLAKARKSPA